MKKKSFYSVINATILIIVAFIAGAAAAIKHAAEVENRELLLTPQPVIHTEETADRVTAEAFSKPTSTAGAHQTEPTLTTSEAIVAINAGYEQIAAESENEPPKAATPQGNCGYYYELTDAERQAIENIVASEGGYCDYEFQALVAECILNGCIAEDMRPLEIFNRGDFWLTNNVAPTETTKKAVSDVFDKGVMPTAEKVRYYYNPNFCESPIHESMCYVLTCCDCRFFKDWE